MKKVSHTLLIALILLIFTVALGFLTSSPAPAQSSVPVTVVNTTASPVPTAAVGTTLVAIRGTPTVNDATTPFEERLVFNIDPGNQQNHGSFAVPTGKRLVIEHISANTTGPSGQKFIAGLTTEVTGGGGLNWLVLQFQGTFPLGTGPVDVFTLSQSMHLYTESPPIFIVTRTDITGSATADATISGYLVNQ